MAEASFETFCSTLEKALGKSASGSGFAFDKVTPNLAALWKQLQDRQEIISKLKEVSKKSQFQAREWIPPMAQADFMSRCERDLRLRFRSRIGMMRRSSQTNKVTGIPSLEAARTIFSMIEA